jgi:hypothetical protein
VSLDALHWRIQRVRAKLAEVAASADVRLGRALPEGDIAAFEARLGIRLPSAYRAFLTAIGHAGYGPDYGLLPLDDWGAGLGDPPVEYPSQPFPVTSDTVYQTDWEEYYGDRLYQGTVSVVHRGCTEFTLLVITGPARGRLVEVTEFTPPRFYIDNDFLAWYERWLDFVAAGYDLNWFSESMAGTDEQLADVLSTDTSAARRDAAACALIAHPDPGGERSPRWPPQLPATLPHSYDSRRSGRWAPAGSRRRN